MHNIKIVGWEKPKVASGGMITDPMGQWAHPGKNTRIPGNNITMQGVPYPVLAKASNGQQQMMYPGQDYSFPGASHVDEYPMMRNGGRVLPKAQTGLITNLNTPTRGDSLFLLNNNKIINNLLDSGKYNWMIGKDDKKSSKKNIKPKDWKKIFEQKKEFFDISIPNEVRTFYKKKGKLSDYKKEKGKFIGTSDWAGGGGDDYGFPIQYIHPDIVPQYEGDLEPKDSNDPFVYSFGYDDLAITPWDMLNKKQQQERIKKYGVTGTPYNNSPEPPSLKRKTEDLPLLPFTHPAFNPQIIGNKGQINLPLPSIPNLPYRVEYMGEDSLPTHSYFPSNKEGEAFMNEIQNRPQGISGNVPGGSISGYYDINRMRHTETPKQKLGGRVLPKAQIMGTVPFTTSYTATPSTSKTVVSKTTVADPNSQLIKDYNNPPTTDFDNFLKIQEKAYDTYYQNYNVTNPSYTDPSLNNSTVNLTTGRYKGAKVPTKILDDLIASAQKNNFPIGKLLALAGRESTFGSGDANSKFRRDSQSGLVSGWNVDENYKPYELERFLADNQVPGVKAHKESDGWWYETTDKTKRDAYLKTHPNLYNRYQKKLNSVKPLGNKNYFDLAIEFLNNKGIKKYNPGDANYINLYNQDYNTLQTDPAIQQYLKSKNVKYNNGGSLDQYQSKGQVTRSPIYTQDPNDPRLRAFNDSSYMNKYGETEKAFLQNPQTNEKSWNDWHKKASNYRVYKDENNESIYGVLDGAEQAKRRLALYNYNTKWAKDKNKINYPNGFINEKDYNKAYFDYLDKGPISRDFSDGTILGALGFDSYGNSYQYSKPVQPVIYKKPQQTKLQTSTSQKPTTKPKSGGWKPLTSEIAKGRFSGDISNMIYRETGDPDNPYNITGAPSKPEPTLKRKTEDLPLLPYNSQSSTPQLKIMQHPNIQLPPIQQGRYKVDYFDPTEGTDVQGGWHTKSFMSDKEAGDYMHSRPMYGPSMTQRVEYKNGGLLDQYQTQGEVTSPIVDEKPYTPYRVDYLNAHTGKRDSKWFEDEESSRYFVKNSAQTVMDPSGVTGYYEKPPGKKKPPSPTEQQRLKDQAELKDTTKSFYNQWYNSPMHSQMLKESLRKPFGTGLFLNKRVKNKTQDRLNTINNEMDLNLEPYPEGSFDVSVAGEVKRNRPNLINISPFSTLEGQKGTSIHEGAHVTDLMSGIPKKDIKKMQNYANFNMPFPESLSAGYSPQDQTDFKKYVSKDTETRARVMNGKYVLSQIGSQIQYDPFTQKLNKDQFYKAEQLSPEFKEINDQLRSIYSEDEILNLHNTLSKTNNTQPQTMAKYGGPLADYYAGRMNHGEIFKQGGVASNEGYYNKGMGIPKFQTAGNVTNTPPQDPRSQKFYNNLETYFNNSTNPRDHALYESFKKFNSIHGYAPVNINGKTIMGDRAMTNPFTGSLNLINNGDPNDLIDQYMAEYPHYQQYNEHPERSKFRKSAGFLGKVFKDYGTMFKNLDRKKTLSDLGHFRFRKVGEDFTDAYEKNYETPGTSEYQAHKVMEPANWNELERYYKERMAAPRFDDGGAPCPDGYIRNAAGECVLIGSNLNTKSAGDNTRVVNPGMTDQGVLAKDLGNTNNFNKGWMQSPMYHQMITASVAASNNPNDKDIPEVRERLSDPSRIQVVQKDLNNPNKGGETVGLPYTATGPVSKVILNTNTTIPRQEAMDHEILGHATDLNGALIPQPDKEKMDKYFTPQEKIDTSGTDPIKLYADGNGISYADAKKEINEGLKNPEWAKEWNKHVSEMNKLVSQADKTNNARSNEDKYISGSSETRARMMSVRKLAKDNGVYDPFTQKMTRENLRKLKSLNNFELDSLFNNYTEDELLDMFNSISKSNSGQEQTMAKYGGGIHIKPSHVGRFTEYKQRTGKTTEEALHSPDPHVRQMANFARNAAKWKHAEGGQTDMICYDDQGRVRPCGSQDYLNKWLGNPMGRAEKTAEAAGEKWFNPQTKKWESEQMDNFRHPTAGRYTAEAIANKFPSWMQYTPIPKATGFIGSNLLGLGHELIETSDNPDYSLWDKIREGGEDAFNNMVGAGVGSLPFVSDAKKTAMLKYLSDNNLLPDGIGKVDAKKNNGKGNLYKKANGGDISIPQLPQHNSPLLQFYYAKTGGQTPRNIPQSMVNQEKKLKLKYGIKYKL